MFNKHAVLETRVSAVEREYGRSETGTRDLRNLSLTLFIALFAALFSVFIVLGGIYWKIGDVEKTQITQFNELNDQFKELKEIISKTDKPADALPKPEQK